MQRQRGQELGVYAAVHKGICEIKKKSGIVRDNQMEEKEWKKKNVCQGTCVREWVGKMSEVVLRVLDPK